MSYDAFVFDNDGVLTTPTDREVLLEAIRTAFAEVGASEPTAEQVRTLLGPDLESLREIAAGHGVDPKPLWQARERAAVEAQLAELRAERKRTYADVSALDSLVGPLAIVSNNQHETIGNILDHCSLAEFDAWYGREPTLAGIERKKPAPYYLERAIDEVGAENPLYVGDSRVDVAAADAIGIDSAFIRREHRYGYELSAPPTHEIDSLEELRKLR
jgi:phosphoglycolate phosphatase